MLILHGVHGMLDSGRMKHSNATRSHMNELLSYLQLAGHACACYRALWLSTCNAEPFYSRFPGIAVLLQRGAVLLCLPQVLAPKAAIVSIDMLD